MLDALLDLPSATRRRRGVGPELRIAGIGPATQEALGALERSELLHGQERRRIAWTDGGYALRGLEDAPRLLDELRRILADNPSVISPGVLARPAVQDALLGTTLQVMGPAELSFRSRRLLDIIHGQVKPE